MKLSDMSTGPAWIVIAGAILFAVIAVILLLGHGIWFLSGYNVASDEEKSKYNEKKLCRVAGIGMAVISILLFVMTIFEDVLPASFAYISLGIVLLDIVGIIVASKTICKK